VLANMYSEMRDKSTRTGLHRQSLAPSYLVAHCFIVLARARQEASLPDVHRFKGGACRGSSENSKRQSEARTKRIGLEQKEK